MQKPADALYARVSSCSSGLKSLLDSGELKKEALVRIAAHAGVITCAPVLLIPPNLQASIDAIKQMNEEYCLGLCEDQTQTEENAVLYSMFSKAQMFTMLNFFKNYRENPAFWPPLFQGQVRKAPAAPKAAPSTEKAVQFRGVHKIISDAVGQELLNDIAALKKAIKQRESRRCIQDDSPVGRAICAQLSTELDDLRARFASRQSQGKEAITKLIYEHPGLVAGTLPSITPSGHVVQVTLSRKQELDLALKLWQDVVERS